MNAKPYPKYKASGVEWLGDVPEHWTVKGASKGFEIQLGKMLQPDAGDKEDLEVPYLKSQHVQWERVRVEEPPQMWASPRDVMKYGIRDGDLLVCEGGDVGRAAIVRKPEPQTIIQNALHRVRSSDNNDVRFLMRVLEHASAQDWFSILCNRSTIAHFTSEKFGALTVPFPPPAEQQAIADFLDERTEKLDGLLGKKRELIGKLKEKRSALISRTVTKGLPPEAAAKVGLTPNPKLKPSGISWLGDIPEHWEVVSVRYAFYNLDFRRIPIAGEDRAYVEKKYPYYGASGIIDHVENYIFDETLILVAEDGANLLSRSSPLAFLAQGKYWVNNHAHILKPISGDIRFWVQVLATYDYSPLVSGAAQPKLTSDRLGGTRVPQPPCEEQAAIANFLEGETSQIDRMIQKVETAIEKLTEYRTALITAAVTGKIDVRKKR